jgi:hexokinase
MFAPLPQTESDPTDELLMVISVSHFFAVETTLAERQFFHALAEFIGRRAARLSACGIAAIVSRMGYLATSRKGAS